jgi:hypothetical protein
MRDRFQHAGHVLRVAAVLAAGLVVFLVARWFLMPSDFGVYGFYRAGALNDVKARPVSYAGAAACEECHAGTYDPPDDAKKKTDGELKTTASSWPVDKDVDNKHVILRCEACHGPLKAHAEDPEKSVPKVGKDQLCLTCHREVAGRPPAQPQVIAGDHGDNDPCVSCHKPHRPKTDEDQ